MVTVVTRGYKHVSVAALFIIKQLSYPILSKALQGVTRGTGGYNGLQRVTEGDK